jgi:hypothetical protein
MIEEQQVVETHTIIDDYGSAALWLRQRLLSAIGLGRNMLLEAQLLDWKYPRGRIYLFLAGRELA